MNKNCCYILNLDVVQELHKKYPYKELNINDHHRKCIIPCDYRKYIRKNEKVNKSNI